MGKVQILDENDEEAKEGGLEAKIKMFIYFLMFFFEKPT